MQKFAIYREKDDALTETHVEIGNPRTLQASLTGNEYAIFPAYVTFSGDPEKVVEMMRAALVEMEEKLPKGVYDDRR